MNVDSATGLSRCLIGGLLGLAWLHALPAAGHAEQLPLPPGDKVAAPWKPVLTLDRPELKPGEAARVRLADDAQAGRALVVGPWLAGAWRAGVQYGKPFPPSATEVRGQYRTVDLLPYTAGVRADFYDAGGKRLNRVGYPLLPTAHWTPLSVRFDKFPVGTARMEFSFCLGQHTQGEVWFAQLETQPAGLHPLADLPAPKLTRPAPPPPQKGTGFSRVERFGETWWLIDPEGRPSYSRATAPPNPPTTWEAGLATADKYVAQLRDWGFDGLAGWHSLRLYALYNRELKKQGRPTIPQFAVLNYHDCFQHGEYEDFIAFERRLYQQYVDVTLRVTRQADPQHLIASNRHNLGGLEHWLSHIDLCAAYDLVAVNLYSDNQVPGVEPSGRAVLREVARRSGRPVIIGEWSVPALDSGLYEQKKAVLDWSFPQAVPTQAIRARQAARITADFFNEPYLVGAHWFIYADFDSSEREANRGLVRSDGQPWDELVRELQAVHRDIQDHTVAGHTPDR